VYNTRCILSSRLTDLYAESLIALGMLFYEMRF